MFWRPKQEIVVMTRTNWQFAGMATLTLGLAAFPLTWPVAAISLVGLPQKNYGATTQHADQDNLVALPSRVDGVVLELGQGIKRAQEVKKGQVLLRMEDDLAKNQLAIAESKVAAARAEQDAAKVRSEGEGRYQTSKRLFGSGSAAARTSEEDLRASKLVWDKKASELASK